MSIIEWTKIVLLDILKGKQNKDPRWKTYLNILELILEFSTKLMDKKEFSLKFKDSGKFEDFVDLFIRFKMTNPDELDKKRRLITF